MQLKQFVAVKSCEDIFKGHNRTIDSPPFHPLGFSILVFSYINRFKWLVTFLYKVKVSSLFLIVDCNHALFTLSVVSAI